MGNSSEPATAPHPKSPLARPAIVLGGTAAIAAILAAASSSGTSTLPVTALLLLAVVLGGGIPLGVAGRRHARLRRAVEEADFARLASFAPAGLAAPGAPRPDPLSTFLQGAPDRDLIALGDSALASAHPFAAQVFTEAHAILLRRHRDRRRAARRRAAWPSLCAELSADDLEEA